jgi:N-glycosylase/DNA lyase
MAVNLTLNPERAREVARELLSAFEKGGIFGKRQLPDDAVNELLPSLEFEEALLLVTFTTALDYMRNASELWSSSIKTFSDEEVKWVFDPKEVNRKGAKALKKALLKHGLAKKKNRDPQIWFSIASSLAERHNGSLRSLFESYGYDVEFMFKDFLKNRKEEFPSLSGEKLFPHWIRSLRDKFNLPFKNVEKLPIPVDVHVARATFTTGCITGKYSAKGLNETIKRRVVKVWEEGLKGTGIAPMEMFRPLWLLSKYGCHYRKNGERPKRGECPVGHLCVDGKVVVTSGRVEIDTK